MEDFGQPASTEIIIVPVANGWIVRLPKFQKYVNIQEVQEYNVKRSVEILAQPPGDPVLNKLQGKIEKPVEPVLVDIPISDMKDRGLHIFKEFSEVLEFLKENVK